MDMAEHVNLEDPLKKKARGVCASEGSIAELESDVAEHGILEDLRKKKARGGRKSEDSIAELELDTAEYVIRRIPSRRWRWTWLST